MIADSSTDDTEVIAALKIAASSPCAAKYSKNYVPKTWLNAGWPVLMAVESSPNALHRNPDPNATAIPRADCGWSLRSVSLSGVLTILLSSVFRKNPHACEELEQAAQRRRVSLRCTRQLEAPSPPHPQFPVLRRRGPPTVSWNRRYTGTSASTLMARLPLWSAHS